MILFYSKSIEGEIAVLEGSEAIHCKQALRKEVGDEAFVTDGLGQCFKGQISQINKRSVEILLEEQIELSRSRDYKIHIGIAPTKNISRFEWFLEKATEFGIDEVTPLLCARSERKVIKEERLLKILVSAMKQSLKCELPVLNPLTKIQDFIEQHKSGYIAHLEDKPKMLIERYESGQNAIVMIGPEGDFSPDEIELAINSDFLPVSLGDYRLRTETAGIAAVQQIHFVNMLRN